MGGGVAVWDVVHPDQTLVEQVIQICSDHNVVIEIDKLIDIGENVSEVEASKDDILLKAGSTQLN